jgi:hypothetical protein
VQLPDSPTLFSLDVGATTWRFWHFDDHFWARPDTKPLDWIACFLDFDKSLSRLILRDQVPLLRERLRLAVQNEGFFRTIQLSDGPRILLHRSQLFILSSGGELARFWPRGPRWSKTAYLLDTPTDALRTALERERKRTDSDLSRAFAWLALAPNQRKFIGLQWTTGDSATLERLVPAAFWNCDELWDGTRDGYEYTIFAQPGREFLAESGVRDPTAPRHFRPLPPKLVRALTKIIARNRPFWPLGVQLNRQVGSGPLAQRETRRVGTISFSITEPNAHEKLEARLDLRDFLQSEAPELFDEWF